MSVLGSDECGMLVVVFSDECGDDECRVFGQVGWPGVMCCSSDKKGFFYLNVIYQQFSAVYCLVEM